MLHSRLRAGGPGRGLSGAPALGLSEVEARLDFGDFGGLWIELVEEPIGRISDCSLRSVKLEVASSFIGDGSTDRSL